MFAAIEPILVQRRHDKGSRHRCLIFHAGERTDRPDFLSDPLRQAEGGMRRTARYLCIPDTWNNVNRITCNVISIAVTLLEYDGRFKIFGADFIQYDYKFPLDVPRSMSSHFDLVIADPPFLSEECLTKTAVTIKFLTKKNIVLCTGVYDHYFSLS